MKQSLSYKLFGAIFIGFLALILLMILFLNIYFTNFYEASKINSLVDQLNTFESNYAKYKWNNDELFRQIEIFSSNNNVVMTVVEQEKEGEEEGREGNSESSEGSNEAAEGHLNEKLNYVLLTTVDSQNRYYDLFVPSNVFKELGLTKDDNITVVGVVKENDTIDPVEINGKKISEKQIVGEAKAITIKVSIVTIKENLTLPIEVVNTNYAVLEKKKLKGVNYTISQIPHTQTKQVTLQKEARAGNNIIFNVVASLQPIQETTKVLGSFSPYMIGLSLLASIVIAFIHSRWVSQPIRQINTAANAIASLKFNHHLDIQSKDELGQLSTSLNTMSDKLEKSLSELTIAKEELQKDYDLELARQKMQKEFVANASHELKTPLGIIKGYAEGIRDGVGSEETNEYLEVIVDEAKKMDILIRDMLQISKLNMTEKQVEMEEVDMEVLTLDVVGAFEKLLDNNEMLMDISGEYGLALGNYNMLMSAVQNMVSNAVKYGEKGSTIKIRSTRLSEGYRFEIQNDCTPLTEAEHERIWEKFYKGDVSHNRAVEGTGLGLAIVKGIFESLHLEHGVRNTERGVIFWFNY